MYKIIKKSNYWFVFSGIMMILSVVFIATLGLRWGIDYKGGTVIEAASQSSEKITVIESALKESGIAVFQIKETDNNKVILKLPVISNEKHLELTGLFQKNISDYEEISYNTVGPVISKDLTNRSIIAVILASIGIIFYIAYAFRKLPKPLSPWRFGLSAVVALVHDLLITTGIFALIGYFVSWMEVDVLFITALLTIMGFSVHDTIVVYDRLRENFLHNPHQEIEKTAEESINQTLARSINTSLTVLIVLTGLFLLGGDSIKHFVLTLIIGITFGTYSSIFVATALLVRWHKKTAN